MTGKPKYRLSFVYLALVSFSIACAGPAAPPPPPDRPQPISVFEVRFTPAGPETYPASNVEAVKRYKTIAHWPGEPDWISDVEVPSQPYVVVGQLDIPAAWQWLEKGVSSCPGHEGLVVHHVRAIGGDAILLCEVNEHARGVLKNADSGEYRKISYRGLSLQVIRYTDR